MLTYSFKELDIPMYEYLYQCIKNDIIHQKLKPHEKLPSKRAFAKKSKCQSYYCRECLSSASN